MFNDLKEAIEDVLSFVRPENHYDEQKIENLKRVYALYFVEPEDDKEFVAYQEPLTK